jgi:hypothetical protein
VLLRAACCCRGGRYRCTTLWAHDEASPKSGYIWRMRNPKGDYRVQTDIMGGAYCVTTKHTPFIGPKEGGRSYDPRTGESVRLDDNVHTALCAGIDQMVAMHANLGAEIYSVGWDLLVVNATPVFIEFNIGNGFYVRRPPLTHDRHCMRALIPL